MLLAWRGLLLVATDRLVNSTPYCSNARQAFPLLAALPLLVAACIQYVSPPTEPLPAVRLAMAEALYRDARDLYFQAYVARATGSGRSGRGMTVAELERSHDALRERAIERLAELPLSQFGDEDLRAIDLMRRTLEGEAQVAVDTTGNCRYDAAELATRGRDALSARIYRCYGLAAGRVVTATDTVDRLTVLSRLATDTSETRRRGWFLSLRPTWESVNAGNSSDSPWRRLVALNAAAWRSTGSPIAGAARSLGIDSARVEPILLELLDAWRTATPDTLVEPWDWYFENGAASRRLDRRVPLTEFERLNEAWFSSLGASPRALGVRYDLVPREGKTPVAFTQFGGVPRRTEGGPRGAEPWVVAAYRTGGLGNLAEVFHETGHAIHIAAIETRPAFADWPDSDPFTEGVAEVPALEIYEGRWQLNTLGDSATRRENLRERYGGVMLDVAWALFELRMHGDPVQDPNAVWSDITSRYLHIRPHPEWSWWAMRGQLVRNPGYMMNYALGAMVAAEVRAKLRPVLSGSKAKNVYEELSRDLYRHGRGRPVRDVLTSYLGHAVGTGPIASELRALTQP